MASIRELLKEKAKQNALEKNEVPTVKKEIEATKTPPPVVVKKYQKTSPVVSKSISVTSPVLPTVKAELHPPQQSIKPPPGLVNVVKKSNFTPLKPRSLDVKQDSVKEEPVIEKKSKLVYPAKQDAQQVVQNSVPKVDKEKILTFCKGMTKHLNNEFSDIVKFFKARPKDPLLLMYDEELKYFAISTDGETWVKNIRMDFEVGGYLTVPERGTVWQSRTSRALFLVMDFCNLRTTKAEEEPPLIVYMDELGNNKTMHITAWHSKMMFCDHTVGKD